MAREWLENEGLSVYVVYGAPRGLDREIRAKLKEKDEEYDLLKVDGDLEEWVLARVRGEKRHRNKRSPSSKALWRAFRALAAARYHLTHDDDRATRVRDLRDQVEQLWLEVSPLHAADEEEENDD